MDSTDDLSALRIERTPAPPSRRWVKWVVLLVLLAAAGVRRLAVDDAASGPSKWKWRP